MQTTYLTLAISQVWAYIIAPFSLLWRLFSSLKRSDKLTTTTTKKALAERFTPVQHSQDVVWWKRKPSRYARVFWDSSKDGTYFTRRAIAAKRVRLKFRADVTARTLDNSAYRNYDKMSHV